MENIILGNDGLTIDELVRIARNGVTVSLSENSVMRINRSRDLVERLVDEEATVYGITTGFGALSTVPINKEDTRQLQRNILMSHAAGVGKPFEDEVSKAMMALRIKDIARGHAGVSLETTEALIKLMNRNIIPVIPEKGSVGASGDLVPLAHLSLILLGMGEASYNGEIISGEKALEICGLKPLELGASEGLGLINGTQAMTAVGGLAVHDAVMLSKMADIAAAMSIEVLMGSRSEFDPRIQAIRPHPGQIASAANMERMTRSSDIVSSHRDCSRVQDAYSLRCSPQVHGASKDAVSYAARVVEIEMNASTNNPLIFSETDEFLLGGNFHGQPVALAMDFMCMAVAELANISERRIERMVNPMLSGLPAFLVKDGGLNSGFMIAQYTAASLVSENKVLCHPACVDSIPTSANKEDHVSMGTISARKSREIIENTLRVIAIEMLCNAQAMDVFTNMKAGEGTRVVYDVVRKHVSHMESDRFLAVDIEKMVQLIKSGEILTAVEKAIGPIEA